MRATSCCAVLVLALWCATGVAAEVVAQRDAEEPNGLAPTTPGKEAPPVYTDWPFDAAEATRRQKEWADYLGVPVERDFDLGTGAKMTMVLIPPGEFLMGSPADEEGYPDCEGPQHRVRIAKPFYLAKHEVTQEQWQAVMQENPSHFKGKSNPVETVSWNDCQSFCRKTRLRLPTESEWEYSCRAGTQTPFHFGQTISTDQANYDGNYTYGSRTKGIGLYRQMTTKAASFPPNAWGLHDMHGNLWELCGDLYRAYGLEAPTSSSDPQVPLRGGSWGGNPDSIRSAYRGNTTKNVRNEHVGFRAARDVGE